MIEKDRYDEEFTALNEEHQLESLRRLVTDAVISGRLSVLLLTERALKCDLTLDQFYKSLKLLINEEIKSGVVDEISYGLMKEYDFPDIKE